MRVALGGVCVSLDVIWRCPDVIWGGVSRRHLVAVCPDAAGPTWLVTPLPAYQVKHGLGMIEVKWKEVLLHR